MPEITIVVEGIKYVLVPDSSHDCKPCAFCGRLGVCSTEKIPEPVEFNHQVICRKLNGVWKRVETNS